MMLLEINNPTPVPIGEFVTYFENSFGISSGCIPKPVSLILTRTWVSFFSVLIVILPSLVNLTALHNRFEITSNILTLSALTKIGSFCDGVNTSCVFSFDNSFPKSLITFSIFWIKSNLSFSSLRDWLSILAISKMFCSSRSNLFAFLMIMSRSLSSSCLLTGMITTVSISFSIPKNLC